MNNPRDYNLRLFRQGPTEAYVPPAGGGSADTAAEILTKLITVDGTGSGLDADLLDGHDSSFYAPIGNAALTGNPTAPTPSFGDNDTSIATTAFVFANAAPIANPSANLLINGDMVVSQEYGSNSITPVNNTGKYTADQWIFQSLQAANTATWGVVAQASSAYPGLISQLTMQAATAWSAGNANDSVGIYQCIEGQRWAKLGWGNASALPVSIGFWINANVVGICALSIRNAAGTRSYVTPISVTAASTWQYKIVTIPGDVMGTWPTDTGIGAYFALCFGSGATSITPNTNVWQAGNFSAQTGITNFFAANGNNVSIAGVSLIPGSTPVPLEQSAAIRRDSAEELLLCQRYLYSSYDLGTKIGTAYSIGASHYQFRHPAVNGFGLTIPIPSMRAAPTISVYDSTGASNFISYYDGTWHNGGGLNAAYAQQNQIFLQHDVSGAVVVNFALKLNARL